jgi:hypothetical protein
VWLGIRKVGFNMNLTILGIKKKGLRNEDLENFKKMDFEIGSFAHQIRDLGGRLHLSCV